MKKKVSRNKAGQDDPLEVDNEQPYLALVLLAARALAMLVLALFSVWFLCKVWGNLAIIQQTEVEALGTLAAVLSGNMNYPPVTAAAFTAGAIAWVLTCILSAIYLTVVSHRWVKKIKREWVWVWRNLSSNSWWDRLFGVFGFVLTLAESVFWLLVTVVTVVIVYINLKVLIPVLP